MSNSCNAAERVLNKLDKLDERLDRIDITLAAQHVSLVDHIRRTSLLEKQVEPIKQHVIMVKGIAKFIGLIGGLLAFLAGVFEILTYFKR